MSKFSKAKSTLIHQTSTKLNIWVIYLFIYLTFLESTFMLKESKEKCLV